MFGQTKISDTQALEEAKKIVWQASMTGKPVHIGHLAAYAADDRQVGLLVKLAAQLGVQVNG